MTEEESVKGTMNRKGIMINTRIVAATLFLLTAISPVLAQAPVSNDGLKSIVAPGATLEKVASGFRFTEGPVYDRKSNSLLFSDQPTSTIQRFDCATGKVSLFRGADVVPNGNTFDSLGRLVGCEHKTRRISRTDLDGRIVTLAYLYGGKRLNSPNDLAIKSDGTIYFTDPPYGLPNMRDGKEQSVNGLYRIDLHGDVTLLDADYAMPNGIAFSPDEKTLYVDDTERQIIRAYDVSPDGSISNGRTFADLHNPGKDGAPDGLKVDTKGNVFSTGGGGVWVITPTGKVLGIIETPETAANCGFGDKDGKSLYITARTGLYRIRLQGPGPIPGPKGK